MVNSTVIIDVIAVESLIFKPFEEVYELIEKMETNNFQWPAEREWEDTHIKYYYTIDHPVRSVQNQLLKPGRSGSSGRSVEKVVHIIPYDSAIVRDD
ncbi:hypothetical protein IEQ34_009881 [Dendrobium chrysotoxum]|uniref:Uncharacterized protein n=1 Tax=Dendrobium chrysotoxum TaxID=161865 RepID=A0AAV7H1N4_DENCH|nr:hypothetical protein IEQ34_009881 [Dendrobium chrysotoxum]